MRPPAYSRPLASVLQVQAAIERTRLWAGLSILVWLFPATASASDSESRPAPRSLSGAGAGSGSGSGSAPESRPDAGPWTAPIVATEEVPGSWGPGGWPPAAIRPDGSRIVLVEAGQQVRVLSAGLRSACDPCVSTDGRRVLFAAKETAESRWNIFEIGVDGSGLRRVTGGPTDDLGDCVEPEYLARGAINAPDYNEKVRWIAFTSNAPAARDRRGGAATALHVRSLEAVPGRGVVTWRTTYSLYDDFSPTVLSDGQVLFSSWQAFPGRHEPKGVVALLTISWSGEDINLFCGNEPTAFLKSMACETPDRSVVYVESDGARADRGGALARVRLRRPLKTREVIGPGPMLYRNPHPLPDGRLLVAASPDGGRYALLLLERETGAPGTIVLSEPEWSVVEGVAVAPRREPVGRISMVDDSRRTALLACLDVHDSDLPEVRAIPRGSVAKVRFLEGAPPPAGPRVADGGTPRPRPSVRVLGDAPVEKDGSFFVELPADTPFTLQLLGGDDRVLATMPTWIGLRPHDERTCMGCHEDKEMSPRNFVPEAFRKATPWRPATLLERRVAGEVPGDEAVRLTNGGGSRDAR